MEAFPQLPEKIPLQYDDADRQHREAVNAEQEHGPVHSRPAGERNDLAIREAPISQIIGIRFASGATDPRRTGRRP
jgi:hypothetical protein